MARLIKIIKVDEDPDTVYYRFGPAAGALIATAGISKSTGETVLLQVDADGALRDLNVGGCHLLGVAVRKAWETGVPPTAFSYRSNMGRTAQVQVLEVTDQEALLNIQNYRWDDATATYNFENCKARFIALENSEKHSDILAASMFPYVQIKLDMHYAKGEFPDETAFIS